MRSRKYILAVMICMVAGVAWGQEGREAGRGSWRDGRSTKNRDGRNAAQNASERNGKDKSKKNHKHTTPSSYQQSDWGRGKTSKIGMSISDPQQREQYYGKMVDHYLERMDRTYGLSDEQKTKVRSRLEEVKREQLEYSQQHSREYRSLHDESHRLRDAARSGGQAEATKAKEIQSRYHALRDGAPLMNSQRVAQEVEKLLPPEQVEQSRARHDAEHAQRKASKDLEHQQRKQSKQRQKQQNGGQTADPQPQPSPAQDNQTEQPSTNVPNGSGRQPNTGSQDSMRKHRTDDRHKMRRSKHGRTHNGDEQIGTSDPSAPSSTVGPDGKSRHSRNRVMREDPISPWEQYLRDFIQQYNLDAAQQATAWSIHREMQERRTIYEQSHRFDFEKARQIEDIGQREHRLNELNLPVVRSFDELKARLMRIPSSAQRQTAGISTSTTQPAASSRPS